VPLRVDEAVALSIKGKRGKSGLHRAGCQVTPGEREFTASATENKPPISRQFAEGKGEMVR